MELLSTLLYSVLVLGFLILFHEAGHFLVAKRVGVGVVKFSIGFGPVVFGRKIGETEYAISAIPLGGFVKMIGEDPDETISEEDQALAFQNKTLGQRTAIVLAGPVFNLVFAAIAFTLVFGLYGARVPTEVARVGIVGSGTPAAAAGLQEGDLITRLDGSAIDSWEQLSDLVRASSGRTVQLTVDRGGSVLNLTVTPESRPDKNIFGETVGNAYFIGIERGFETKNVGWIGAVGYGLSQTWWWTRTLATSVVKMVQGRIARDQIGGPIMIVQQVGEQARQGFEALLHFMAVVSINLGVLNLLPIPILDGGHLFFFGIEAVLRRPLALRHREIAQQLGLAVLLLLMAFAFYNDIARSLG